MGCSFCGFGFGFWDKLFFYGSRSGFRRSCSLSRAHARGLGYISYYFLRLCFRIRVKTLCPP